MTTVQVGAAVPPRLLEATVAFKQALHPATAARWHATGTWMAPHAKFFAFYGRPPIGREARLAWTAQSFAGSIAEIDDATTAYGHAALFACVGVGADCCASVGEQALPRRAPRSSSACSAQRLASHAGRYSRIGRWMP
nr:hypothetical protein [Methylorubrum zatmanii]